MEDLLRIGRFARLANVTVKTIRFYADERLLLPYYIDPETGYRYYIASQIPLLTKILNLREAGFSLSDISAILDRSEEPQLIQQAISAQRTSLIAERKLIEARLKIVDALARSVKESGSGGLGRIRLTISDPEPAYTIRRRLERLGEPVTRLFETAEAKVAACDARAPRSPFLLFHDGKASGGDFDLEVCIPVSEVATASLPVRTVPGGDLSCSAIYAGPYDQTEPLRLRLESWLTEAGLRPRGPLREIYHRFGAREDGYSLPKHILADDTADYVTEIRIGVSAADEDSIGSNNSKNHDKQDERKLP